MEKREVCFLVIEREEDKEELRGMYDTLLSNTNHNLFTVYQIKGYDSLSSSMNKGLKATQETAKYFGWIHPDMRFQDKRWLEELIDYLEKHPECMKVCSQNTRDEINPTRLGHEQCYIMRVEAIDKIGLFDEKFRGIGGWEDIDYNRRILEKGYTVIINNKSLVYHRGMGTRSKRDTNPDQYYNNWIYNNKWKDGVLEVHKWEFLNLPEEEKEKIKNNLE